jgi:ACS family tartrate transporter-like MFS transporter
VFERGPDDTFVERSAIRKVTWRIVPFLTVCYFFAILDRSNVGLASLQMNSEIGLSKAAFGFGGCMYFVAYFLFEVPSKVILKKVAPTPPRNADGTRLYRCC